MELLAINHSFCSSVVEALPCSVCFATCMGAFFSTVELDNAIQLSTLSRASGFPWDSSKWVRRFGRSLQYALWLEVLACSFYTDFSSVITMLQLLPTLNCKVKLQQLLGGRWIAKLAFRVYSKRSMSNASSALTWTQGPLLNFPAKCINFLDPKLSIFLL